MVQPTVLFYRLACGTSFERQMLPDLSCRVHHVLVVKRHRFLSFSSEPTRIHSGIYVHKCNTTPGAQVSLPLVGGESRFLSLELRGTSASFLASENGWVFLLKRLETACSPIPFERQRPGRLGLLVCFA